MTKDELHKIQYDAAIELIVQMDVQMDYRRSTPLSSDWVVEFWDAMKQRYDETLKTAMDEYYQSNDITLFADNEQPVVAVFIRTEEQERS